MKVKALIAVRSGSVRVDSKNIRPFAGSTIVECKIAQLLRVKNLDGIVVNSNDDSILELCSKYDVELVKRDQHFASNEITMSEVYQNMAENFSGDVVVYANATSPLIEISTIETMIEEYNTVVKGGYDSLNSVQAVRKFLFKDGKPLNYSLQNQPRSQDLPDIYSINFAISILSTEKMKEYRNVVGRNPCLYEITEQEGVDIDTMFDFKIAEFLYKEIHGII